MKKFIVVTRGRTGSTIICDTFAKVTGVACGQELARPYSEEELDRMIKSSDDVDIFEKRFSEIVSDKDILPFVPYSIHHQDVKLPTYFDYLQHKFVGELAVGFKALVNHLGSSEEELLKIFKEFHENEIKIIYLQRSDVIREAFSVVISRARKIYNIKRDELEKVESLKGKLKIDPEEIQKEISYIDYWKKIITGMFEKIGCAYKVVYFEDFLNDKRKFLNGLLDFLEIDAMDTNINHIDYGDEGYLKVTPEDLNELVENFNEIISYLNN